MAGPVERIRAHVRVLLRSSRFFPRHRRYRRAGLSSLASAGASAAAFVFSLITVPLLLNHLGAERFGMWMTVYAFVLMLGFLDLGVGNALMTAVARADGRGDRAEALRYISSGLAGTVLVAGALGVAFAVAYPFVPWERVLNVQGGALGREARLSLVTLVACVLVAIPAGTVIRVQTGLQQAYFSSLWDIFGKAIGLAAVFAVVWRGGGVPLVVAAVLGSTLLATLLNGVVLFGRQEPSLRPSLARVEAGTVRWLVRTGTLFLVLQLVGALAFASDNLIIAHVLGPAAVTDYAVPRTLFQWAAAGVGLVLTPLWPAYSEAIGKGDRAWAVRTLRRSVVLVALVAIPVVAVLAIFGNTLLSLWVGRELIASPWLLAGFAVWATLQCFGHALAMFMNAALIVRFQVVVASIFAVICVISKYALAMHIGIVGVIWALNVTYVLSVLLPISIFLPDWIGVNMSKALQ